MLTAQKTQRTALDNGVRVVTESTEHSGAAAVSVLVDAGPQDDPKNRNGLAHFCEHAAFLGTPLRDHKELALLIDAAGGCFGAFTAPDYTCFYSHVLQEYVSYAIDLLGDILVASTFPESCLDREKDVISQEITAYRDSPQDVLLQLNKKNLWPDDTLSQSVLGDLETVRNIDRSDVMKFVSRHYTPDRIIVAVAGGIEHESVVEQVQDAFWPLRGQSQERSSSIAKPVGGVSIERMSTRQCSFSIAIPTPPFDYPRRYALHVLNNLIGGGMSSRLYQTLREHHGLVYNVQSSILSYRRGGALVIEGATSKEQLVQSVALVLMQLMSLATGDSPIDDDELWKSKMQVKSQSQLSADMASNRVSRIATQEFHLNRRVSDAEILDQIESVSFEDLQQVSIEILLAGMKHLSIAAVGPIDPAGSIAMELKDLHENFAQVNNGDWAF